MNKRSPQKQDTVMAGAREDEDGEDGVSVRDAERTKPSSQVRREGTHNTQRTWASAGFQRPAQTPLEV